MRFDIPLSVVIVLTASVAAQNRPDFSGNWILVSPQNSNGAQTMTVRETFARTSVSGAPIEPPLITLAVERRSASGVRSDRYTIGVVSGTTSGVIGNAGAGVGDHTPQTRSSTTWDGDRLVIETRSWTVDDRSYSDHKEVWWLDAQGALLISVTDEDPGDRKTTTLLYRRRP
jgi:hypothetical protein